MSSSPTSLKRPKSLDALQIKFVDKVASWLMSFVVLVGLGVLVLLMIFLSRTLTFPAGEIEVVPVENVAGRGDNAEGFARDFEPPGAEEVEEMTEPTLAESLEAVTSASPMWLPRSIRSKRTQLLQPKGRGEVIAVLQDLREKGMTLFLDLNAGNSSLPPRTWPATRLSWTISKLNWERWVVA